MLEISSKIKQEFYNRNSKEKSGYFTKQLSLFLLCHTINNICSVTKAMATFIMFALARGFQINKKPLRHVRIVHAATVRSALQRLHAHARLTEIIINA
jgi:hypothetical protein